MTIVEAVKKAKENPGEWIKGLEIDPGEGTDFEVKVSIAAARCQVSRPDTSRNSWNVGYFPKKDD